MTGVPAALGRRHENPAPPLAARACVRQNRSNGRVPGARTGRGEGLKGPAAMIYVTLAAILASATLAGEPGAPPPGEVGIFEKLGAQVPLDLGLVDEQGRKVTLGSLIDRPTLLTLNYFRCASICTPQLNHLADALDQLALDPGKDFKVVTVSFDDRDTPEIAAQKRSNYLATMKRPFPDDGWRFITGDAASTRALADSVGFKFRKQEGGFLHPAAVVVLSPRGRVTRYIYGLDYLPAELTMAIGFARQGIAMPTVNRWLRFCYAYDPAGQRYVFDVTRVGGVITLLAAAGLLAWLLLRGRSRQRASARPGGPRGSDARREA